MFVFCMYVVVSPFFILFVWFVSNNILDFYVRVVTHPVVVELRTR